MVSLEVLERPVGGAGLWLGDHPSRLTALLKDRG